MKKTFVATDGIPGMGDYTIMMFELASNKAKNAQELVDLARQAAKQYAITERGCADYCDNCYNFNWGDLIDNAENEEMEAICDKLGLTITWLGTVESEDQCVDFGEQLMENCEVKVNNIVWDTDGEKVDGLPKSVTLTLRNPVDDIADALSDEYGFCVKSYAVNV